MNTITAMNKRIAYVPTTEETNRVKTEMTQLLNSLVPNALDRARGVDKMFGEKGIFWKRKGWIISAMKNHPNYNGNYQIVFPATEMKRKADLSAIHDFEKYWSRNFWVDPEDDNSGYCDNILICTALRYLSDGYQYVNEDIYNELVYGDFNEGDENFNEIRKGEKFTRLIGRIAKKRGADRHVDLKLNEVTNRYVDYGWTRQYAKLCDAVSVKPVKETIVISVNPYDFYTCSHGNRWSTCYETRKTLLDNIEKSYGGAHCNGIQSLLVDDSTFIVYTIKNESIKPEVEPKKRMCFFYLGEDKLIQSRVYPDAREFSNAVEIANEIRNITQKAISDMFDIPNYWTLLRGCQSCEEVITRPKESVDYPDYRYCEDVNVSFAKIIPNYKNVKRIVVGGRAICPECGELNMEDDSLFCVKCEVYKCDCCGNFAKNVYEDDRGDVYCEKCKKEGHGVWNFDEDDE